MITTLKIDNVLTQLSLNNVQETLRLIDTDSMLSVTRYSFDSSKNEYMLGGPVEEICIANASKGLFTPVEEHQLLAKGIVYIRSRPQHYLFTENWEYTLVSLAYTKFQNSFEGFAVADIASVALEYSPLLVRKYDGTLISRFVEDGRVYFATRGKIISLEVQKDNPYGNPDFNSLVLNAISKNNYQILLDPNFANQATIIMELIGPSNVVVEFHSKDDLVVTGVYDRLRNKYINPPAYLGTSFGLNLAETYSGDSALDVMNLWSGVQEGIVVSYVDPSENVRYRVKFKQEAYLNIVRAKNSASKANLLEMAVENGFQTWDEIENHLNTFLGTNAYYEELINFYKEEWPEVNTKIVEFRLASAQIMSVAALIKSLETRKEQFFRAADILGKSNAGICMCVLDGKLTENEAVGKLYAMAKKGV